jgi:hypothetical protein
LTSIIGLNLGLVGVNVLQNEANGALFTALQHQNAPGFYSHSASTSASISPESSLRIRVFTLPRIGRIVRSGRRRNNWAWRRKEAVPTFAPFGKARGSLRSSTKRRLAGRRAAAHT